jgi:hypothetical protein
MASGEARPVSASISSTLGKNRSHCASVARSSASARGAGHSAGRKLRSKLTFVPAARARAIASSTVSQALALMACEMPDTWSQRAPSISPAGSDAGLMRLAALPARRYEKRWPCSPWVTK